MAAEWIKFGEPENESEWAAIRYLSGYLPKEYRLYTNLEISQGGRLYEIDIILVAPHCVYVVDVKGVHGRLEIDPFDWYPENRQSYPSPLKKYRQHARTLKSLIKDADRFRQDQLDRIWVQGAVLLTIEDVIVEDVSRDRSEEKDITYLGKSCLDYFQNQQTTSSYFLANIQPFFNLIDRAIRGRSKPISKQKRYGQWEVIEQLGEKTDRYVEYLVKRTTIGLSNRTARLRVYSIDPLLDAAERQAAQKLIYTAFQAVEDLPPHDNILAVQGTIEGEDAASLVIVTEDIRGQSLRQHINKQDLNLEQSLNLLGEVLRALDHAHQHGVTHRNITPETIFVTTDKQAKLTGFDYARIDDRSGTIANQIGDELEAAVLYQDYECQHNPAQASPQSDLFAVGQVFYELLLGEPAFQNPDQMLEARGIFRLRPSEKRPQLPKGFDSWLQKLCAFDRADRFISARDALDQLTPLSKIAPDLTNLSAGTILDNQYKVVKRLGLGSFAVAYQVLELFSEDFQVIKIAVRDNHSLFERVQQEFKILYNTLKNPHHHIVTARWPGQLKEYDNTPFILFEYVEGETVEQLLGTFSLEEAIRIIQQTAAGLQYLHQKGIQHQDIKPANLVYTSTGIKIIDFNVAVSTTDESAITAGTRRYLPPSFKASSTPSIADRIDRDLYALGITAYQCITGHYPFDDPNPMPNQLCKDPRQFAGCEDLSDEWVEFLQRSIAPEKSERFQSVEALLAALDKVLTTSIATPETHPKSIETSEATSPRSQAEEIQEATLEEAVIAPPEELQPIVQPSLTETALPAGSINVIPVHPNPFASQSPEGVSVSIPTPIAAEASRPSIASSFNLFDPLPPSQQARPNPDRPIILDPSGAYPVPGGYLLIDTEVTWMRHFGISNSPYWVQGELLCEWARCWLESWNRTDQIAETKQRPQDKLRELLHPMSLPTDWTEAQCLAVVTRLEAYEDQPIARLLADLTRTDLQIWLAVPSIENLAHWLPIQVPGDAQILEKVWQRDRENHELGSYYQTDNKQQILRQWLGIAQPTVDLPPYPLDDIPSALTSDFDRFWQQEMYRTQGSILDARITQQPGQKRISQLAYSVLKQHPGWITKAREGKLRPYLTYQQYDDLQQRHRPPEPAPLSLDASPQEALNWVTQEYLPLRRWETVTAQTPQERRVSDRLAASFEDWILKHYPALKVDAVENSWLNYNVCHRVQQLCTTDPVLWVVVDGLGWLDHQILLSYLTDQKQLHIETGLQPRFSILPTKTEYAKWSLYSQQLPGHGQWSGKTEDGFMLANARRYTDNDVKYNRLQKDLARQTYPLYCWDTCRFDDLYHHEVDWQELYTVKRSRVLRDIAEDVIRFVAMHPQQEKLRVVIASDHGQLMGTSSQITHVPPSLTETKERMAIGTTDDERFAVLAADRFGLPHSVSVIRGAASFSSFSYADDKSIVGCHGGLYPEEVVVGFSVLKRSVQRLPVQVVCSSEGKSGEPGQLLLEITNPNPLSLVNLRLFIQEINSFRQGQDLDITVAAKPEPQLFFIPLDSYPELPASHPGNALPLVGKLEFTYQDAETATVMLEATSAIVIKDIFRSGIEGLDEFFT